MDRRIHVISDIADFLSHKDYRTLALVFTILYFSLLYGKFGYLVSLVMFKESYTIAWITAVSFSICVSAAASSLIILNKSSTANINIEILCFDILISFFFYADVLLNFFSKHLYGIGLATVIFAIYTPRLFYHLSEQFRQDNLERVHLHKQQFGTEQKILNLAFSLGASGITTQEQALDFLQKYVQEVTQEVGGLRQKTEHLSALEGNLQQKTEQVSNLEQKNREMGEQLAQMEEQRNQAETQARLEKEAKEGLAQQVEQLKNTRAYASHAGAYKRLVNEGKVQEAEAKRQEILQKYGRDVATENITA